jgi:hypothetical protein
MSNPSLRVALLRGVLKFVAHAKDLSGVSRIALIGSLTTTKPNPKDADVLVTVSVVRMSSCVMLRGATLGVRAPIGSVTPELDAEVGVAVSGPTCAMTWTRFA